MQKRAARRVVQAPIKGASDKGPPRGRDAAGRGAGPVSGPGRAEGSRGSGGSGGGDEPCYTPDLSLLVKAVESEVIPRLLAAHKPSTQAVRGPGAEDVETMASMALSSDSHGAVALAERLIGEGIAMERIYLDLLGATARRLGQLWDDDRVSFVDVTLGLCTLHQVLFRLAPHIERVRGGGRTALFAPVPGESHIFGALIVARFFTRAGWRTWTEIAVDAEGLSAFVREEGFDLVGLSIASSRHAETLAQVVASIRAASPEGAPVILVGGFAVQEDPGLPARVGADATAADPVSAVDVAESLVPDATRAR